MSVVVAYEELGPCQKKLTIEVPLPEVEAETGRVVREYAKSIHLPGFRRGKVPAALVRKRFQQEIEEEVAGRLVPRYLQQAQDEKNLEPLLPPQVEELIRDDDAPMRIVASLETRPEIDTFHVEGFELPTGDTAPSEAEVEEALADVQRQAATWQPVDRPAARGDRVIGTVIELTDESDETEPRDLDLELVGEKADEELLLALTGVAADQSAEFSRKIGEGEEAREARFRAEISEVQERDLPELNDDLALKMGRETFEKLQEEVSQQVAAIKSQDLRRRREKALLEQLRERHPLQLPDRVVEQEVQHMLREYAERMASQGIDFMKVELDWRRLGEELRPQAEIRVHSDLLLDAVARDQGIRVEDEQIERLLAQLAQQQGMTTSVLRRQLSDSGRLEGIKKSFLRDATIRRLLGEENQGSGVADGKGESQVEILPPETQD